MLLYIFRFVCSIARPTRSTAELVSAVEVSVPILKHIFLISLCKSWVVTLFLCVWVYFKHFFSAFGSILNTCSLRLGLFPAMFFLLIFISIYSGNHFFIWALSRSCPDHFCSKFIFVFPRHTCSSNCYMHRYSHI